MTLISQRWAIAPHKNAMPRYTYVFDLFHGETTTKDQGYSRGICLF